MTTLSREKDQPLTATVIAKSEISRFLGWMRRFLLRQLRKLVGGGNAARPTGSVEFITARQHSPIFLDTKKPAAFAAGFGVCTYPQRADKLGMICFLRLMTWGRKTAPSLGWTENAFWMTSSSPTNSSQVPSSSTSVSIISSMS